jgi:membrane protease YdiL (CAAX protease family)
MLRLLRALPPRAEFAIVVIVVFGPFVALSIWTAIHSPLTPHHTNASLLHLSIYEAILMSILFPLLRLRGWSFAKIGMKPELWDIAIGAFLFVATYIVWAFVWDLTIALSSQTARRILSTHVITGPISITTIIANGLINPFFEESFLCGYVMTALGRERNPWLAINVSVAIRVMCHLYQGPLGVLSITPMGLIASYWFARTGRLWPLVISHSLADILAMSFQPH